MTSFFINHESTHDPVRIWQYHEAPEKFQRLSNNGGDEDWLALIPPNYEGTWFPWMEEGTSFGCCDVSEYRMKEYPGYLIVIGSHA